MECSIDACLVRDSITKKEEQKTKRKKEAGEEERGADQSMDEKDQGTWIQTILSSLLQSTLFHPSSVPRDITDVECISSDSDPAVNPTQEWMSSVPGAVRCTTDRDLYTPADKKHPEDLFFP